MATATSGAPGNGWHEVALGRFLAARTKTVNPAASPNKQFELYSVPSFDSGRPEVIPGGDIGSSKQAVSPGDVLLCKINPRINRVWIVGERSEYEQIGSTEWIRFPKHEEVVPGYLAYYLQLEKVRSHLAQNASGVGGSLMRVKGRTIANEVMPLPNVHVQRRIVAQIDVLFSELDDGEEELRRARVELQTCRKSLLKAAVTGELTANWRAANPSAETGADLLQRILADRRARWQADPKNRGKRYKEPVGPDIANLPMIPESWTCATLPQLGDFGRGKSKHRPRNDPRLYGGPYPFVQTGIVAASRGRITSYDQTYSELGLKQSKLWPTGTLCITIAANIAKSGVLQFDACFPDSVVGLSPADGVHSEYVELVIRTLQAGLEKDAPATAQKNINLETLTDLPILLPPSTEQLAIVEAFEDAEAVGDLILHPSIDADAAVLRQSILAAAFRGELIA